MLCLLKICLKLSDFIPDKYASQFGAGSQYAYYHEGDESAFQLVDTSKPHKTAYQRNKQRFNNVSTMDQIRI